MRVHGEDIDDRSRRLALPEMADNALHQEHGRSRVHREEAIEEDYLGVGNDPRSLNALAFTSKWIRPNASRGRRDDTGRHVGLAQIGRDESRLDAEIVELRRRLRANALVPASEHDARGSGARGLKGHGTTDTLGGTSDQ
jgi:hypothetical protein